MAHLEPHTNVSSARSVVATGKMRKMCVRWDMRSSPPVACTTFADVVKQTVKKCPHSQITISALPIVVHAMGDLPIECLPIERLATNFASTTRKKKKMMSSVLRSILRNVH